MIKKLLEEIVIGQVVQLESIGWSLTNRLILISWPSSTLLIGSPKFCLTVSGATREYSDRGGLLNFSRA